MSRIHPNDMDKEQLLKLVKHMAWMILDLAQDLCVFRDFYKGERIPDQFIEKIYALAKIPYTYEEEIE